jgi:hypothetical protein
MPGDRRLRDERAKQVIDVWKTVVGVQMHFNEIGMRIRGLFVTILLALFASIGFLLDKELSLPIWRLNIQFTVLVPLFGVFATMLFYLMDRYWFHRLLKGSVNHAIHIERKYKDTLPELSLSDEIGKESFFAPTGFLWLAAKCFVWDEKFRKNGMLHSDGKLAIFYKSMIAVLIVIFVLLIFLGGITLDKKGPPIATKKSRTVDRMPIAPAPPAQAMPTPLPPAAAPTAAMPPAPAPSPRAPKE